MDPKSKAKWKFEHLQMCYMQTQSEQDKIR